MATLSLLRLKAEGSPPTGVLIPPWGVPKPPSGVPMPPMGVLIPPMGVEIPLSAHCARARWGVAF